MLSLHVLLQFKHEAFKEKQNLANKISVTHHVSALMLVWEDPKGLLILTKFKGSSSHFCFDNFYIFDFHSASLSQARRGPTGTDTTLINMVLGHLSVTTFHSDHFRHFPISEILRGPSYITQSLFGGGQWEKGQPRSLQYYMDGTIILHLCLQYYHWQKYCWFWANKKW